MGLQRALATARRFDNRGAGALTPSAGGRPICSSSSVPHEQARATLGVVNPSAFDNVENERQATRPRGEGSASLA